MDDRKGNEPALDDCVIIKVDNTPLTCWPLAFITQTLDGNDNIIRFVQLKTQTGVCIRPVSPLIFCPLIEKLKNS